MMKKIIAHWFIISILFLSCSKDKDVAGNKNENETTPPEIKPTTNGPLVVGYFPSWSETYPSSGSSKLRDLPKEITHVFLSFVKPNMNYIKGSYDITGTGLELPYTNGTMLKETVAILKAKGTRVILSIGGETYWNTEDTYNIAYDQIRDFVEDFGFGGVDWDFEPNGTFDGIGTPQNIDRFITMIREMRKRLPKSSGYEIACAPAGCGALGGSTNNDLTSPYSYEKRTQVTGESTAHEFNATSPEGYTISLYGFRPTGHMIPVFKEVGNQLDFVAFQGYNVGSAKKREIMYDSYAYYANLYGFKVAFGMHVPQEPWGPLYTYSKANVEAFATYVAKGGTQNIGAIMKCTKHI